MRGLPDPTRAARVVAVWEGIRRTHGAPADQAAPLMPPELLDVLEACPVTKTWATPRRLPSRDLAGARDKALLLVGFVGALRRSELVPLDFEDVNDHPQGLVVTIPRSKTPTKRAANPNWWCCPWSHPGRCPVRALRTWAELAAIASARCSGPSPPGTRLSPGASVPKPSTTWYKARSSGQVSTPSPTRPIRCGRGSLPMPTCGGRASRAIAHQTRHRSMSTLGQYVRIHEAWQDNAATQLGL